MGDDMPEYFKAERIRMLVIQGTKVQLGTNKCLLVAVLGAWKNGSDRRRSRDPLGSGVRGRRVS